MPSDDDGYEPALDTTTTAEASVEAEPAVKREAAPQAAPAEKIGAPVTDAVDDPGLGPRAPRVRSEKNRAMFRELVKQVQAGEVETEGELEPMTHTPPPAAAAPAAAPVMSAPAVTPPAAAPAAPVTPPPGLPPLPAMPLPAAPQAALAPDPKHAEREAAIAAREAALVEREKLMPDRAALAERPAEVLAGWLRNVWDIAPDDHEGMKVAMTDLITELSERGLGVKLPDEVKTPVESRKALRAVKVWKAETAREKQSLAEQRAAQEKEAAAAREADEQKQRDSAYIARIGELIAPAKAQHVFLHDPEVTGGLAPQVIVYEVLKEQKRLGQEPDLAKATEYANNYYKAQAEAVAAKAAHFQSLLAPAAPAPAAQPAKVATSPGGVPGPAPTKPATPAPVEWDPSDLPMDRQQRRAQSLRAIAARVKAANQQ